MQFSGQEHAVRATAHPDQLCVHLALRFLGLTRAGTAAAFKDPAMEYLNAAAIPALARIQTATQVALTLWAGTILAELCNWVWCKLYFHCPCSLDGMWDGQKGVGFCV